MALNDILTTSEGDALVSGGDFTAGNSEMQHQQLLLMCNKGEFKQHPDRCVGAMNYVEGSDTGDISREILTQFTQDGMKVSKISAGVPNIYIEAEYV